MRQKLELTWAGKDEPLKVEPRILLYDAEKSHGAQDTGNLLIHGDNLLALKALEKKYAGQVKCIYIDPPYNTGSAFEHYDDNMEHSTWLNLMYARIRSLYSLLADDGFFCCEIDDSEGQYLKIVLDEIFGRNNYKTTLYVRVRYAEKTLKEDMKFNKEIEQIHIYQKTSTAIPNQETENVGYEKFVYQIEETSPPQQKIVLGGKEVHIFQHGQYTIKEEAPSAEGLKEIWASGTILDGNSSGRFFRDYLTGRYEEDGYGVLYKVYGIGDDSLDYRYFTGPKRKGATKGKYYQGVPKAKLNQKELVKAKPISNFYDFAANFGNCRQEGTVSFRAGKKPEALLNMLLDFFSNPGDLVLDSFLGSGTTAAVAQKMGRRWIGIEMGDHAYTHCKTRLDKVIDGEDAGGVTKATGWQGGGGYRFYELAPTLILRDAFGEAVISDQYNAEQLAAAVALHEGYTYQPDDEVFWKQAVGTEKSYLFTTTRPITAAYLDAIAAEMQPGEFLKIAATSFPPELAKAHKRIALRQIPEMLLAKCAFGVENYNLPIVDPPTMEDGEEDETDEIG